MRAARKIPELTKRGGKSLQQQRLLFRKDGAEVEDQAVFFNARDNGDARGGAAQALLELRCRVASAGDADDLGGQRLRGRRATSDERRAVHDLQFHLAERQLRRKFAKKILSAALEFLRAHTNHA